VPGLVEGPLLGQKHGLLLGDFGSNSTAGAPASCCAQSFPPRSLLLCLLRRHLRLSDPEPPQGERDDGRVVPGPV
jgi:hypothetical protein